jgi:hypothetical protein
MLETGTKIEMTKGYKGIRGTILYRVRSEFDFYVIVLDNDIRMLAGPGAFVVLDK